MNPADFLEVLTSLSVQVALMIGIGMWATRRQWSGMGSDRTWTVIHVCTLLLTAAAFAFPHLRPITLADFHLGEELTTLQSYCNWIGRICFWIWLTGALALTGALVGGIWKATYLVRHAIPSAELTHLLKQAIHDDRWLKKSISVRVSSISVSPFCWQFHRPVIVVPDLLLDFPPGEQLAVLKHERTHLEAQHPLGLFLQRLVEAVFWFHPLVWHASRLAAGAREFRCDRRVVRNKQDLANYLRSLLRLIESEISLPNGLSAGVGFLGDKNLLTKRADALAVLFHRRTNPNRDRVATFAVLFTAALCALIWVPVNPEASRRSWWSPWPEWSASALDATGIHVRDYEIDGHRLQPRRLEHHPSSNPDFESGNPFS